MIGMRAKWFRLQGSVRKKSAVRAKWLVLNTNLVEIGLSFDFFSTAFSCFSLERSLHSSIASSPVRLVSAVTNNMLIIVSLKNLFEEYERSSSLRTVDDNEDKEGV